MKMALHHRGLALLLLACLFVAPATSAVVPVLPLPTPPATGGPDNGGQFRFATVSWIKLQHYPPTIRFTVEAAFRRGFTAINYRGTGPDGKLIVGDKFRPNGLESIMFDFGDGLVLTPMEFSTIAWSETEDWVQGVSTFEHTYANFTNVSPYIYTATFKGCCRLSSLSTNKDTSFDLKSVMNIRDDWSSPRITSLPVVTVIQKKVPGDAEPSFYLPASENFSPFAPVHPVGLSTQVNWTVADAIGAAPASIGLTDTPANLPNVMISTSDGRVTFAAGPVFSDAAATTRCNAGDTGPCMGSLAGSNVDRLEVGMYNVVLNLKRGESTSPVEFMLSLVAEDSEAGSVMPRISSPDAQLLYPQFSYTRHVGYVGFPINEFELSATTDVHGVNLGFTVGRIPEGAHLSTVSGGSSRIGFQCYNGTSSCAEDPATACNGTSYPGCTCLTANTGLACGGLADTSTCNLGGLCKECWDLEVRACPTSPAVIKFAWTPVAGQEGAHVVCANAVAMRPEQNCLSSPSAPGCSPMVSGMACVLLDIRRDPPPMIWTSFSTDLDPWASTNKAYLGRPLAFTVYSNDTNCKDTPVISMGPMPPGAVLMEQNVTASMVSATETSFSGLETTTSRSCGVTHRKFVWTIPLSYGGYSGRHCFFSTDSCGVDDDCSGRLDTVETCVNFTVAKCKYAVNLEQSIAEVASLFGTDWIQLFNMNDAKSPDYILFANQVLNIGHMYTVTTGDSLSNIARRFGTTVQSLTFLNYELGELMSVNISMGQDICLIANSCLGEVQSVFDRNPKGNNALDVWYEGVQSAYEALRKAKAEHNEEMGNNHPDVVMGGGVMRRLLQAVGGRGGDDGGVGEKLEQIEVLLAEVLQRRGAGGDH